MKQQILERARSTVEAFLHQQCADTTLAVLSVKPEVDGYGHELLWIRFTYDDGNANGLPDSLARILLKDRLRTELQHADIEAFPVVSFIAESEVGMSRSRATWSPQQHTAPSAPCITPCFTGKVPAYAVRQCAGYSKPTALTAW